MAKSIIEYLLSSLLGGSPAGGMSAYVGDTQASSLIDKVQSGQLSAQDALAQVATSGLRLSPEQESYLSSMLSNQRTNEARDYETSMANTDFLRAAEQLGALGMSPYNVAQTGASATPNVSAASTPSLNNANQRYDRMSTLANSLINMAGRMANAGIYGGALKSVRESAARTAAMASHSATVVRHYDRFGDLTGETETTTVNSRHPKDMLF